MLWYTKPDVVNQDFHQFNAAHYHSHIRTTISTTYQFITNDPETSCSNTYSDNSLLQEYFDYGDYKTLCCLILTVKSINKKSLIHRLWLCFVNWFSFDARCISLYQICKNIKHLGYITVSDAKKLCNFKNTGCLQSANDIQCHIKKNSCRVATSNRNALLLVKNFLLVSYNCKGISSLSLFQYCLWSG